MISDIQDVRQGAISDTFVKSRRRLPDNVNVSTCKSQRRVSDRGFWLIWSEYYQAHVALFCLVPVVAVA